MLIIALIGCDNKAKFDRVDAFNQYTNLTQYTPTLKNIKKQTIKSYIGAFLLNTTIIETDKQGRAIKLTFKYNEEINTKIANVEATINYDDLTFDLEQPMFGIYIKKGNIILDEQGRISKQLSKDGEYSFFYEYKDNKLIDSSMLGPFLTSQEKNYWDNNLLTKEIYSTSNLQDKSLYKVEKSYDYDTDDKLIQSKEISKLIDNVTYSTSFFEKWNEFDDWTTAKITMSSDDKVITQTREIEYW